MAGTALPSKLVLVPQAVETSFRLPAPLVRALDAFLERGDHQYESLDEFVQDAILNHLSAAGKPTGIRTGSPARPLGGSRGLARVHAMHRLYEMGWTLEEVGSAYGLTSTRVRQLFLDAGFPTRDRSQTVGIRRHEEEVTKARAMADAYRRSGDMKAVARRFGVSMVRARELVFPLVPDAWRHRTRNLGTRWSDEEVLWCLRQAAQEVDEPLKGLEFTALARGRTFDDGRPWPRHRSIADRFGSWTGALRRAGVPAGHSTGLGGSRLRFTRRDCVEAIRSCSRDLGGVPTWGRYVEWAKAHEGTAPSFAVIHKRLGSWREALRAALE